MAAPISLSYLVGITHSAATIPSFKFDAPPRGQRTLRYYSYLRCSVFTSTIGCVLCRFRNDERDADPPIPFCSVLLNPPLDNSTFVHIWFPKIRCQLPFQADMAAAVEKILSLRSLQL